MSQWCVNGTFICWTRWLVIILFGKGSSYTTPVWRSEHFDLCSITVWWNVLGLPLYQCCFLLLNLVNGCSKWTQAVAPHFCSRRSAAVKLLWASQLHSPIHQNFRKNLPGKKVINLSTVQIRQIIIAACGGLILKLGGNHKRDCLRIQVACKFPIDWFNWAIYVFVNDLQQLYELPRLPMSVHADSSSACYIMNGSSALNILHGLQSCTSSSNFVTRHVAILVGSLRCTSISWWSLHDFVSHVELMSIFKTLCCTEDLSFCPLCRSRSFTQEQLHKLVLELLWFSTWSPGRLNFCANTISSKVN